jgi:Fe-S cluster assembly protein SufD
METTITKSSSKEKLMSAVAMARYNDAYALAGQHAITELDIPTTRSEEWKYTRTTRISNVAWIPATDKASADLSEFQINGLDASKVIFIDGIFRPELSDMHSLPEGVGITENPELDAEADFSDFYDAYHAALCTSRLRILIAAKSTPAKCLHIIHVTSTAELLNQPLIEIVCEKNSEMHVVESFVSTNIKSAFTFRKMKVHVGSNASLHIDKIQMETSENFMMNNEYVGIEQDGRFTINTLTIESNWVRNQLHIALNGQNIEANLHGFYLPVKKHFVDNHTRVDHLRPHCVSNELYKGMLNDQSNAVFNGKVYVHLDAQKTNAFQSNANILLSDDAQMNTKPELEIYADDVKCSHGSTTGQLDEEALFYLKSRGLGEDNARKLLANAFISDVLEKVNNEAVKHYVTEQLIQRDLLFA